jgi:hypothetical protein
MLPFVNAEFPPHSYTSHSPFSGDALDAFGSFDGFEYFGSGSATSITQHSGTPPHTAMGAHRPRSNDVPVFASDITAVVGHRPTPASGRLSADTKQRSVAAMQDRLRAAVQAREVSFAALEGSTSTVVAEQDVPGISVRACATISA